MVKNRIIIRGDVQGAGYRALVKRIARSLKIKGQVKNLDDGSVEIYCEAKKSVLDKFLGMLDIKRTDGNMLSIDVQEIERHPEGSKQYIKEKAPRPFKTFDIDYGQDLRYIERETLERQEMSIVAGLKVLDGLGDLGQKVDAMHEDMNKRFLEMNEKYHVISQVLIEHTDVLTKLVKDYIETKEKKSA